MEDCSHLVGGGGRNDRSPMDSRRTHISYSSVHWHQPAWVTTLLDTTQSDGETAFECKGTFQKRAFSVSTRFNRKVLLWP